MVLKWVNWVHNDKLGQMVLKGVNWVHYDKLGQMVLKGVNWVHNANILVHSCTIYTYMHHQIPPKCKIYPVGLPSVLYETPGHNERSVLNQLSLFAFQWKVQRFSAKSTVSWKVQCFSWKVQLHEKCHAFQWKCWKVQHFSMKSAVLFSEKHWKAQRFSLKSTTLFSAFQQNFMRFWVITKYRSFVYIRKTKNCTQFISLTTVVREMLASIFN